MNRICASESESSLRVRAASLKAATNCRSCVRSGERLDDNLRPMRGSCFVFQTKCFVTSTRSLSMFSGLMGQPVNNDMDLASTSKVLRFWVARSHSLHLPRIMKINVPTILAQSRGNAQLVLKWP